MASKKQKTKEAVGILFLIGIIAGVIARNQEKIFAVSFSLSSFLFKLALFIVGCWFIGFCVTAVWEKISSSS